MSEAGKLSSTDALRSQEKYSGCSRDAGAAGWPASPISGEPQSMRPTAGTTLARPRLNPRAGGASIRPPPAHAGKPTAEERHGQGSDAQQQGEEEAEGGVEQEEERRPHALAVRVGPGATPARPESLRQEELDERPIDGAALQPLPSGEERSVKPGGHRASATPQR